MLDISLINETIKELEEDNTNFSNCQKLASLYTIKEYYDKHLQAADQVELELHDILPQYNRYCEIKKKYQLGEVASEQVLDSMKLLCQEIEEFIHTLYSSTDMEPEREQLRSLIQSLGTSF